MEIAIGIIISMVIGYASITLNFALPNPFRLAQGDE
jgi:hypothetical protein